MRMLDNVIDINYYAVQKARNSNMRHRPVGLGIMGFQDCLHRLRVPYASPEAVEFADRSMEMVAYATYWASTELAEERGRYGSFPGSLWDRGVLPQDTLDLLAAERGGYVELDRSATLDWDALRGRIKQHGMRNSNCIAIAPTATIANIVGVSAVDRARPTRTCSSNRTCRASSRWSTSILVRDLKQAGLWDEVMIADVKYFDGNLARIDRVPADLRRLYATAFEIEPKWLVEAAARRQKWIDQSQSLNIYMPGASGKKLDDTYKLAWIRGLKTTYYLRAMGATHAEKSTSKTGQLNAVPRASASTLDAAAASPRRGAEALRDRQPRVRGLPVVITLAKTQVCRAVPGAAAGRRRAPAGRLRGDGAGLAGDDLPRAALRPGAASCRWTGSEATAATPNGIPSPAPSGTSMSRSTRCRFPPSAARGGRTRAGA